MRKSSATPSRRGIDQMGNRDTLSSAGIGTSCLDSSGATPPCFFSWPYESTPQARVRNRMGVETVAEMFAPSHTTCHVLRRENEV